MSRMNMDFDAILNYFEESAKTGLWDYLYHPKNPLGYSFIVRLHKAINLAVPFKNRKVLDLGCGTGALMPFVINDGGKYIGMDASQKMITEIKRIYPAYVNNKDASIIFGDISKSQLPDDLDIIVGLGFIEYLHNPEELIQRFYDKLSSSGRLILSFPNLYSLDYISLKFLTPFRYIARLITGKSTYQPPRKLWGIKDAKELYIRAGFKNLKIVNYNVNIFAYPFTRISAVFTNFWAKNFEYTALSKCGFFATGFIISGQK